MPVRGVCLCVFVCVCACVQGTGSGAAEDSGTQPGISARAVPPPARRLLTWKRRFASFSRSAALTLQMEPVPLPLAFL